MRVLTKAKAYGAAGIILVVLFASSAFARVQTLETRPGVTVDVQVEVSAGADLLVLLFEGGQGLLQLGSIGFAHRAYPLLLNKGIAAALIDAPKGPDGFRGGLDMGFRQSPAHLSDIDAVITSLKAQFDLPIWLLGTSNGARSVAAYAIHHSEAISGIVLASSSADPPYGSPLPELSGIGAISVPLLALAHRDDRCLGSPPRDAAKIAEAAAGSPAAFALLFTGGTDIGAAPCGVETHHAFHGVEDDVVSAVVAFMTAYTEEVEESAQVRTPD